MRISRALLLFVLAAAVAGVVVPSASALTFPDEICPVATGTVIKVCPPGETAKPYSLQIKGREGTGCVPYVKFESVGTLPPGLTLSSSGLISGTPTQPGSWTFWIEMQDIPSWEGGIFWCGDDRSTEKQFSITILQGLNIQQNSLNPKAAFTNAPYSFQLTAEGGGSQSWSIQSGSLPAGLTLASNGLLSGTPTAEGDFAFVVVVTDGGRSDTESYTLTLVPRLQITPPKKQATEVGLPYRLTLVATGGRPGYTWAVAPGSTLPAGLTLDPATGVINGDADSVGFFQMRISVTDTLGLTTTLDLPVTVAARLAITKKALPAAKVGKAYKARFLARGGVAPKKWIILGGRPGLLPAGIKLNAKTGELSGIPKKAGIYRLRMQVVDKLGVKSALGFVLKVNA
jgi:large repetitive protein